MGKYTNLARKYRNEEPQVGREGADGGNNKYVNINSMYNNISPPSVDLLPESGTNLRTTNLTNLTEVACVHGTTEDKCAVCTGYVRWLIADEDRLRRAQSNPETVRGEFWRQVGVS